MSGVLATARRPAAAWARWLGLGRLAALLAVFAAYPVAATIKDGRHILFEGSPGYDQVIYMGAAHEILHGRTPYPRLVDVFYEGAFYVYPPFLALVSIPFAVFPSALAGISWLLLGLAALGLTLWLLGVRDWRCYGLVLLYTSVRETNGLGGVDLLLLLAVAALWRWRERAVGAAAIAALAIGAKLFLWPLLLWLAFVGRVRAAVLGAIGAAAVVLASWAAIGFRGFADYPELLRRLTDLEGARSYSLLGLGDALGLSHGPSYAFMLAVGFALLASAAWASRAPGLPASERERISLCFVVAAILALSAIVWLHYFVLLIVPIALARTRLSPIWFLPVVPWAFARAGMTLWGWPNGNLTSLTVVLGIAAAVVALAARPTRSASPAPG